MSVVETGEYPAKNSNSWRCSPGSWSDVHTPAVHRQGQRRKEERDGAN